MTIYRERKRDNNDRIKTIVSGLDRLATSVSQLARTVAIMQFSEGYIGEGTPADRLFVNEKVREIGVILANIDKVNLAFEVGDLTTLKEKQMWLGRAKVDIEAIRSDMHLLWEKRNSGRTLEDNETIQTILKNLFRNVKNVLDRLEQYVADFNSTSETKLVFSVKWTSLPK